MTYLPFPAAYHSGKSADLLRLLQITNPIAGGDAASRRCGLTPAGADGHSLCCNAMGLPRPGRVRLARVKG